MSGRRNRRAPVNYRPKPKRREWRPVGTPPATNTPPEQRLQMLSRIKVSGRCQSRKLRYPDPIEAGKALRMAQKKRGPNSPHREERVYQCPLCEGYHLTSMKNWRGDKAS